MKISKNDIDLLENALSELTTAIAAAKTDLAEKNPDIPPYRMMDKNGRYILADLQATYVDGYVAWLNLRKNYEEYSEGVHYLDVKSYDVPESTPSNT